MKSWVSSVFALGFWAASWAWPSWAGDITGKVILKGTPPPEEKINLGPMCGPIHPQATNLTTRRYVVGRGGALANVFVYLKDAKATPAPATAPMPVLDQVGCIYEPFVFGVVVNQPFKVRNSDPIPHNVRASARMNKEFNFMQAIQGNENTRSFDKPEILVRIKCDIHLWMLAYVGVCEHPYFAITDKEGRFKISEVPEGTYTIVAYHQKTHGTTNLGVVKRVEVKGKNAVDQDFTVELR